MSTNRYKLNPSKTQLIWLGTRHQLSKLTLWSVGLPNGPTIDISKTVSDHGVIIDNLLSMDIHANAVLRSCFHQLRQLRTIRSLLTTEATVTLVHAFIASRIDYCTILLYGVSARVRSRFQYVLNASARLIYHRRLRAITSRRLSEIIFTSCRLINELTIKSLCVPLTACVASHPAISWTCLTLLLTLSTIVTFVPLPVAICECTHALRFT